MCRASIEPWASLTASLAAAHQLTAIHFDADFDAAATVLRFQHRWVLPTTR
jgi:hypothetical protein